LRHSENLYRSAGDQIVGNRRLAIHGGDIDGSDRHNIRRAIYLVNQRARPGRGGQADRNSIDAACGRPQTT